MDKGVILYRVPIQEILIYLFMKSSILIILVDILTTKLHQTRGR